MWTNDLFTLAGIVLRTLIVYLAVIVGLRLSGKREVGQMTVPDFVLLLLIANTVQNAMTGPDTSINGGLVAAFTLLVANYLVTRLVSGNRRARKFLEGSPTMLIYHGKVLAEHLTREKISFDELQEALREHGVAEVEEVALAVLEIDGSISVLKTDEIPRAKRPPHRIRFLKRD
jgi:uncharacterized membrane protein YcaP (DUF421 family)